jgi:DNA-binding winged helix-turn-helix (wHTH) protein/predicted ATPase
VLFSSAAVPNTVPSQLSHRLFPPFRLDPVNQQLWRGAKELSVRPKTFEVLRYLVDHPGQLVTKAMLLDAVWPGVVVSDSMPATCVAELRKELGDDARTPQFIETVHRRGYRFIAQVTTTAATAREEMRKPSQVKVPSTIIVGREGELAQLQSLFSQVREGQRLILFVAGEAGIGKTTFVQAFLDSIAQEDTVRIGRGQCVEQYGSGEPYMPVLEALSQLSRENGGEQVVEVLNKFAPTWLAQMPELLTRDERVRLQSEMQGITQQRMLREMTQALDALAAERPIVLLLEDLHWSDFSTLELISAIARRSPPAQMLIVGTYRPVEILANDHPLRTMKQELELHHYCAELRLKLLSKENVVDYLRRRLASNGSLQFGTLAPIIHARTDGNPLFMVNMVDYLLCDAGFLVSSREVSEAEWAETLRMHRLDALRTIRQMIERNLERLNPEEQAVLESASVAGAEFSAAAVAAALERPQIEVESCCTRLSRREQFVSEREGPITWPDGTVSAGFRFHHALYQEVLYGRLSVGHQVHLHRLIAMREETGYGERAGEVATELAHHYSRANDKNKAIQYFQLAGQRAIKRAAMIEAEHHFADALELLSELPENVERDRSELELQLALGPALIAVKGWAASETERAYTRAQELCDRLGDSPELFPALFGIWAMYLVRGELQKANALAEQLRRRADGAEDPALMLYARVAQGVTSYFRGDFTSAREHLEMGISIYDPERHRPLILRYGFDAAVWCLCYAVWTLWHLGYSDQALERSDEALALAQKRFHPINLAHSGLVVGILRQFRREARAAKVTAESVIALSAEQGLTDYGAWATGLRGWAMAQQGHNEEGIAHLQEALAAPRATGAELLRPYLLCLLAEARMETGRLDDGLSALTEALTAVDENEIRFYEAETHRVKGELLLLSQDDSNTAEAQGCFKRAIEIARKQSAKSWELRATTSFARLLDRQGHREEARTKLAEIYNWFTEGFDTLDLKEAKTLLVELFTT